MQDDPRLIKGRHTYGNPRIFGEKSKIYTGNFCSISDFAVFDAGFNHGSNYISQFPFNQKFPGLGGGEDLHPLTYGPTTIGHAVWIGDQAFIRSGVVIGTGSIIGYGAMVTKNVEPYSVVVGNPGKVIKSRYDDLTIQALLMIAWWEWPDEKIAANVDLLMSDQIEKFIEIHFFHGPQ